MQQFTTMLDFRSDAPLVRVGDPRTFFFATLHLTHIVLMIALFIAMLIAAFNNPEFENPTVVELPARYVLDTEGASSGVPPTPVGYALGQVQSTASYADFFKRPFPGHLTAGAVVQPSTGQAFTVDILGG